MFRFQNPEYLWLLSLLVVFIALFIIGLFIRKRKLKTAGDLKLINLLIPDFSLSRRIWKICLISLAWVFMVLALARPQFGSKLAEESTKGVEIIIALDVSNSMLAQDLRPNRLESAKKFIERIISKLQNDKLGLIIFAGDAFVQMPITDDVRSARLFLSSISTDLIPVQGTAIGQAIDLASKSFTENQDVSKVILLLSDGENHEDDALAASKFLTENGIKVFTVSVGSKAGAPIPLKRGQGFLKDRNGNVVVSIPDEKVLVELANATDGIYVKLDNTANASDKIVDEISKLQQGEIKKQVYSEYDDQFTKFAALAFIFLIVEAVISERKNDIFRKINLFKDKSNIKKS